MNWTVRNRSHTTIADVGEDIAVLGVIIVRVEVGIFVMLNTKIVPTYSQIERQTVRCFPRILEIRAEFMVTIAPSKDRRANRERYGTARYNSTGAAPEFPLTSDASMELPPASLHNT